MPDPVVILTAMAVALAVSSGLLAALRLAASQARSLIGRCRLDPGARGWVLRRLLHAGQSTALAGSRRSGPAVCSGASRRRARRTGGACAQDTAMADLATASGFDRGNRPDLALWIELPQRPERARISRLVDRSGLPDPGWLGGALGGGLGAAHSAFLSGAWSDPCRVSGDNERRRRDHRHAFRICHRQARTGCRWPRRLSVPRPAWRFSS